MFKASIFELDGVIIDTSKYHYVAWRKLARKFKVDYTEDLHKNLKGVGQLESLKHILSMADERMSIKDMEELVKEKNTHYSRLIQDIDDSEVLPGVKQFIESLKESNIKVGLGSSSKNANVILKKIKMDSYFEVVVDANDTNRPKPNPEVFYRVADALDIDPSKIVVFESSIKGIQAANGGEFSSIGIGSESTLDIANYVMPDFKNFNIHKLAILHSILNGVEY